MKESGLFPVSRLGDAMRGAGMNPTVAEVGGNLGFSLALATDVHWQLCEGIHVVNCTLIIIRN